MNKFILTLLFIIGLFGVSTAISDYRFKQRLLEMNKLHDVNTAETRYALCLALNDLEEKIQKDDPEFSLPYGILEYCSK